MAKSRKRVAIIGGTGAEGSGIALRLANAGYEVVIGSRDLGKGERVIEELRVQLSDPALSCKSNKGAADAADIVILTVPYSAQISSVNEIRSELDGKILIDATVPLVPPKVAQIQLPAEGSAVAAVQRLLGDKVRVVSAFQNVSAHKLRHLGADVDCDVLVCGDDADAKEVVMDMLQSIGLNGIDAGPICNSLAAEALTSILITINRRHKVSGSGIRISGLNDRDKQP